MREYKIKRGHNPDIESLLSKYFKANGDIHKGFEFEVEGIGKIDIRHEKSSLFVDIDPPKKLTSNYSIIKKWNEFLYEAKGKHLKKEKRNLVA